MSGKVFEKSKWIWHDKDACIDDRAEFYTSFKYDKTVAGRVFCRISCDSDYALYINGKFIQSNQYGDFPYYKIYDEFDVTNFLKEGKNHVSVSVWYFGKGSQKYYSSTAGVIFEFVCGDIVLSKSDGNIFARKSLTYACGRAKNISSQLGMSFLYDINFEDKWKNGVLSGFTKARTLIKDCIFFKRPNKKLLYGKAIKPASVEIKHNNGTVLVDLGRETVGLATLKFFSDSVQRIMIIFGEKLVSGNVSRFIGGNDYSFELIAKKGDNEFFDPFLRLGCRYLQICSEKTIKVDRLSLIPVYYPVEEKPSVALSKKDADIYRLCVDTLKLCMLEHYVDCPFREQGLYAFDSRNQMLAGYYAFGDGYFEYAKSNLMLFAEDKRKDKLLSITAPTDMSLTIPSFSLYYVLAVYEYLIYSGDRKIGEKIIAKITDIISVFSSRIKDGLVLNFLSEEYWNFYDWTDGADYCKDKTDLFINCLYLLAVKSYRKICNLLKLDIAIRTQDNKVKKSVLENFYDKQKGLFFVSENKRIFTELGNSLAILAGVIENEKAKQLVITMQKNDIIHTTLATKTFFYDALLYADKEKYSFAIIKNIRKDYGYMLKKGATATWETKDGEKAFSGAGSLCHGWSAIPIYYYNVINNN